MTLEKLIKKLSAHLSGKKKTIKERCDMIHELMDELENKKKKIKSKLQIESKKSKRKDMKIELKIIDVQIRKAKEKLAALKRH